jgi:DNA-binding PadR family transcriptional regulator
MSYGGHIVSMSNGNTVGQKNRGSMHVINESKEVQVKLMKGLLDLIVLQLLNNQPMHGYKIITRIRRGFGVYFGPSTIYPLLNTLEKKGYVKSDWDMRNDRPRKVYKLTTEGHNLLNFTEDSLNLICRKMGTTVMDKNILMDSPNHTSVKPLLSRTHPSKPRL